MGGRMDTTEAGRRRGFVPRRLLRRLAYLLTQAIDTRVARVVDAWRHEAHRLIALLALAMAAASLTVSAIVFAVFGLILALWETHRVLAFVIAAAVFALCAVIALLLIRRNISRARAPGAVSHGA